MKKNPAYSLLVLFFLTVFSACEKDADEISKLSASSTSAAEVLNDEKLQIAINPNPAIVGDEVSITAGKEGADAGTLYLQEKLEGVWTNVSNNPLVIGSATLADNGREFRSFFDKAIGNDFYSTSLTLQVLENCSGFTLTPITTEVGNVGDEYTFSTTYEIKTCDRAVNGIKLQGGLTAGATFVQAGTTAGFSSKTTGKGDKTNTVVSWNVGDMAENTTQSFTIVYKKTIPCGTTQSITGAWSAKGRYADDNSAAVAGYDNSQEHTSQDCD